MKSLTCHPTLDIVLSSSSSSPSNTTNYSQRPQQQQVVFGEWKYDSKIMVTEHVPSPPKEGLQVCVWKMKMRQGKE